MAFHAVKYEKFSNAPKQAPLCQRKAAESSAYWDVSSAFWGIIRLQHTANLHRTDVGIGKSEFVRKGDSCMSKSRRRSSFPIQDVPRGRLGPLTPGTQAPGPGELGYRTRSGRTGYDPIENQLEAAHMAGRFAKDLFRGKAQPRHPLVLLLFSAVGVLLVIPTVMTFRDLLQGHPVTVERGILLLGVIGIGLVVYAIRALYAAIFR